MSNFKQLENNDSSVLTYDYSQHTNESTNIYIGVLNNQNIFENQYNNLPNKVLLYSNDNQSYSNNKPNWLTTTISNNVDNNTGALLSVNLNQNNTNNDRICYIKLKDGNSQFITIKQEQKPSETYNFKIHNLTDTDLDLTNKGILLCTNKLYNDTLIYNTSIATFSIIKLNGNLPKNSSITLNEEKNSSYYITQNTIFNIASNNRNTTNFKKTTSRNYGAQSESWMPEGYFNIYNTTLEKFTFNNNSSSFLTMCNIQKIDENKFSIHSYYNYDLLFDKDISSNQPTGATFNNKSIINGSIFLDIEHIAIINKIFIDDTNSYINVVIPCSTLYNYQSAIIYVMAANATLNANNIATFNFKIYSSDNTINISNSTDIDNQYLQIPLRITKIINDSGSNTYNIQGGQAFPDNSRTINMSIIKDLYARLISSRSDSDFEQYINNDDTITTIYENNQYNSQNFIYNIFIKPLNFDYAFCVTDSIAYNYTAVIYKIQNKELLISGTNIISNAETNSSILSGSTTIVKGNPQQITNFNHGSHLSDIFGNNTSSSNTVSGDYKYYGNILIYSNTTLN